MSEALFTGPDIADALEIVIEAHRTKRVYPDLENFLAQFRTGYADRAFNALQLSREFCGGKGDFGDLSPGQTLQQNRYAPLRLRIKRDVLDLLQGADGLAPKRGRRVIPIAPDVSYIVTPDDFSEYRDIALALGADAAITAMISAGLITEGQRYRFVRYFSEYIGTGNGLTEGDPETWLNYHPAILEIPRVRMVFEVILRMHINRKLVASGIDAMDGHTERLENIEEEVEQILADIWRRSGVQSPSDIHVSILDNVVARFGEYANYQPPHYMVSELTIEGVTHPFPSWMQRVSVIEALQQQAIMLMLSTGGGKTAVALLAWEEKNRRRALRGLPPQSLLYLIPHATADEHPYRFMDAGHRGPLNSHDGYYLENHPNPTVIASNFDHVDTTSVDAIRLAARQRMLVGTHSMLYQVREGRQIIQHIADEYKQAGSVPGVIAVDESDAYSGIGTQAQGLDDLLASVPQETVVIFNTATPGNTQVAQIERQFSTMLQDRAMPSGVRLDDPRERFGPRKRRYDPSLSRTARFGHTIGDIPPRDIDLLVNDDLYECSPLEFGFIRDCIMENEAIPPPQQIDAQTAFLLNPPRVSGVPTMPWSVRDACIDALRTDLDECDVVAIITPKLAEGVTRESNVAVQEVTPPLSHVLEEFCHTHGDRYSIPVHFHVIDGYTNTSARVDAYSQAQQSRNTSTSKTVLFMNAKCIETGKNLSCIQRLSILYHPESVSKLIQIAGRVAREGNEDFFMRLFVMLDTITEAHYNHAKQLWPPIRDYMYGIGIDDKTMEQLRKSDLDIAVHKGRKSISFGNAITPYIHRRERRARAHDNYFQNRKLSTFANHYEDRGEDGLDDWKKHYLFSHNALGVPQHTQVAAALAQQLHADELLSGNRVLDTHSEACALERGLHLSGATPEQFAVTNVGMMESIRSTGVGLLAEQTGRTDISWYTSTWTREQFDHMQRYGLTGFDGAFCAGGIGRMFAPHSDISTLSEAQLFTYVRTCERVRIPSYWFRMLVPHALLCIVEPAEHCLREEWQNFCTILNAVGFATVGSYSGSLRSTDNDCGDEAVFRVFTGRRLPLSADEWEQRVSRLLLDVDPALLRFTHLEQWDPAAATRFKNRRDRSKIIVPSTHGSFEFTGGARTKISSSFAPDVRTQERQRLHILQSAVDTLRLMQSSGKNLLHLNAADIKALHKQNIFFSAEMSSDTQPVFNVRVSQNNKEYLIPVRPLLDMWDS